MNSNGGGGGVPDWLYWALALLALIIVAIVFMYGGRIWS